jgi:hypothetical protein
MKHYFTSLKIKINDHTGDFSNNKLLSKDDKLVCYCDKKDRMDILNSSLMNSDLKYKKNEIIKIYFGLLINIKAKYANEHATKEANKDMRNKFVTIYKTKSYIDAQVNLKWAELTEDILILRCPLRQCRKPFDDFDLCGSINCECGTNFCCLCFKILDKTNTNTQLGDCSLILKKIRPL